MQAARWWRIRRQSKESQRGARQGRPDLLKFQMKGPIDLSDIIVFIIERLADEAADIQAGRFHKRLQGDPLNDLSPEGSVFNQKKRLARRGHDDFNLNIGLKDRALCSEFFPKNLCVRIPQIRATFILHDLKKPFRSDAIGQLGSPYVFPQLVG